jgi:hypothetical protein
MGFAGISKQDPRSAGIGDRPDLWPRRQWLGGQQHGNVKQILWR